LGRRISKKMFLVSAEKSVDVLHVITIPQDEVHMVRGKVSKFNDLQEQKCDTDLYCVSDSDDNFNAFRITEFITPRI
jgi:hypothetical protein